MVYGALAFCLSLQTLTALLVKCHDSALLLTMQKTDLWSTETHQYIQKSSSGHHAAILSEEGETKGSLSDHKTTELGHCNSINPLNVQAKRDSED